jgi:hypothetical protein
MALQAGLEPAFVFHYALSVSKTVPLLEGN